MRLIKALLLTLLFLNCSTLSFSALPADLVWEYRATNGTSTSGGCTEWNSIVSSTYKWTASASGTNEYYAEIAAGGDPSLSDPGSVTTDGTFVSDTEGTMGSLNAGEWDYGDNDTLGYSTVYVRLDDGDDPDSAGWGIVSKVLGVGIDYANQDSAELSLTDLAMTTATTTLTSATGGFTAAMVGNCIQITAGTNFTTGVYQITVHTDTNTVTLDRDATTGSNGTGGTGAVGGALDIWTDTLFEQAVDGNLIYTKNDGTMSTGSMSLAQNGTVAARIGVEGYNAVRGDSPIGTNRPLIAKGGSDFLFGDYWDLKNFRVTTTSTNGVRMDTASNIYNTYVYNSSGSTYRGAIIQLGTGSIYNCEGESTNGNSFYIRQGNPIYHSYGHDSKRCIPLDNGCARIQFTVCANMTEYAINPISRDGCILLNNTFYNTTTAISATDSVGNLIMNNIFDNNTTGAKWTTYSPRNIFDYNVWDNTSDLELARRGRNAILGDPGLTDPGNDDFTLSAGSNSLGTAMNVSDQGTVGDPVLNRGAEQNDPTAGVGGTTTAAGAVSVAY